MAVPTTLPQRRIIWCGRHPHKAGGCMRHSYWRLAATIVSGGRARREHRTAVSRLTDRLPLRFRKP